MNTVKIRIEDEKDLFFSFDPDEESFTEEVKSYVLRCLNRIDTDQEIIFQILSARPISEERVKKAVDSWIRQAKEDLHDQNHANMIHQLWMLAIAVTFIVRSIALAPKVHLILYTILSTIGSLSLWELANIWIIENPRMVRNKRNIEKLE